MAADRKEGALSKTILVADDDAVLRAALSEILMLFNYQVTEAIDGQDVLKMVQKRPPDLVLLDLMMPRLSGLDACKRLRSQPETADLPIIVFSARSDPKSIREALAAGANLFLPKPVEPSRLFAAIESSIASAPDE